MFDALSQFHPTIYFLIGFTYSNQSMLSFNPPTSTEWHHCPIEAQSASIFHQNIAEIKCSFKQKFRRWQSTEKGGMAINMHVHVRKININSIKHQIATRRRRKKNFERQLSSDFVKRVRLINFKDHVAERGVKAAQLLLRRSLFKCR